MKMTRLSFNIADAVLQMVVPAHTITYIVIDSENKNNSMGKKITKDIRMVNFENNYC